MLVRHVNLKFENLESVHFFVQKTGRFKLKRGHFKIAKQKQKKIKNKKFRLFQYVNIFINRRFSGCFRFIGYLIPAYSSSSRLRKNILFGGELRKMVFCKKYFKCFEKKYDLVLSILNK